MLKRGINKVKKIINEKQWKSQTTLLSKFASDTDKDISTFIKCIQEVQAKRWSTDEMNLLGEIQRIRETYASSNQTITITDYGAGDPNNLSTDEEMDTGVQSRAKVSDIYKIAASQEKFGELIFKIVRNFHPLNCLELGTSLGVSGAYQISALKLNGKGNFTSIEGSEEIANLANGTLNKLDYPQFTIHQGKFADVLPKILDKGKPLDLVFIDGHHDEKATLDYYNMIFPFLTPKAIVIFDDINWSEGMKAAWKKIYVQGQGVKVSFDLYYWGICFIEKGVTHSDGNYYKVQL